MPSNPGLADDPRLRKACQTPALLIVAFEGTNPHSRDSTTQATRRRRLHFVALLTQSDSRSSIRVYKPLVLPLNGTNA